MTPRPARRRTPGRNVDPARVTDTDFGFPSMGQMHRDHARASRDLPGVRPMRTDRRKGVHGDHPV